jgi:hypothetical protein
LSQYPDLSFRKSLTTPAALSVGSVALGTGIILLNGVGFFSGFLFAGGAFGLLTIFIRQKLASVPGDDVSEPFSDLKRRLSRLAYSEGLESLGERALGQFETLQGQNKKFEKLLLEKFSPSEVTFERYQSAAQEVREVLCSHLSQIEQELRSVSGIGPDAPAESLALRSRVTQRAETVLKENETAVSQMDQLMASIAEVVTDARAKKASFESMLDQLQSISERAEKYSLEDKTKGKGE